MKINFVDYLKFTDLKCFANNGFGKLDSTLEDYLTLLIGSTTKFAVQQTLIKQQYGKACKRTIITLFLFEK